ncbi:MAG: hypothetical protein J6C00_13035 [Eubacterium sp.]|nr:hypothetical protein [Eubacterium sp.]
MAALRWETESQAYVETNEAPKRYDPESEAWVETTGMSWDPEAEAWTERWGKKVSAYVYGAALETVTIKKDGIIVATVDTNTDGCSNEQIELPYGTYTLIGSVSGWTEEQTVDKDTTKFRAMPAGSLYWFGNECTGVTGGWEWLQSGYTRGNAVFSQNGTYNVFTKYTNYFKITSWYVYSTLISPVNKIDFSKYSKIYAYSQGLSEAPGDGPNIRACNDTDLDNYILNVGCDPSKTSYTQTVLDIGSVSDIAKMFIYAYSDRSCQVKSLWLE